MRIPLATEKKSLHFATVVTWICDVEWSCWLSQQLKFSCYWGCFPTHFHNGKTNTNTQCLTSSRGSICKQSLAYQDESLLDYTNTQWCAPSVTEKKGLFSIPFRPAHSSDNAVIWGENCHSWVFISFGLLTELPSSMFYHSVSSLRQQGGTSTNKKQSFIKAPG